VKTILTGIKPTGMPHIGNYLGAIAPAIELATHGADRSFLFIADYHSLTGTKDPQLFQEQLYQVAATWLACGVDPKKVIFYRQSDIPEIFELCWILACHVPKGDLNRAHAYKAAVADNLENKRNNDPDHGVNMGLYSYPVLMAADILLFDTNIVPVGFDQVQHVEIARSIAQRMNQLYGDVLVLPQEKIRDGAHTVSGLDGRKMSKSYDNTIPLFAPEKRLQKLINRITTDSSGPTAPKNPDDSLIFEYYKIFANDSQTQSFRKALEGGISWGEAKAQLFELVNDKVKNMRDCYDKLIEDRAYIDSVLSEGAQKARVVAKETMSRVRKMVLGLD